MFEWSEQHQTLREMLRRFCEKEIEPNLRALDEEEMLPYPIMRKLFEQFGLGQMLMMTFEARMAKERKRLTMSDEEREAKKKKKRRGMDLDQLAMQSLPGIEISRYSPGLVTALGVSVGLTANAIMSRGSLAQKERFVPAILKLEKIGAWAITEPSSGSDAFGGMRSSARLDGDHFVLNGQKTFITNGPHADTIVYYAKFDDGETAPEDRRILSFIVDGDTPGLVRGKAFRKMGMHASPTGELFLENVRVPLDRLMGEDLEGALRSSRSAAKSTFSDERTGIATMALGIVERCLELSTKYANERVQFGKPIGERQLIQLKIAKMEVARINIQNILFQTFQQQAAGKHPTLAEASACKLYVAQATTEVCMEAIQLHGGYGYMAEYHVEQLARDAKVLQIYGGTDEIQVSQIARDLLGRA